MCWFPAVRESGARCDGGPLFDLRVACVDAAQKLPTGIIIEFEGVKGGVIECQQRVRKRGRVPHPGLLAPGKGIAFKQWRRALDQLYQLEKAAADRVCAVERCAQRAARARRRCWASMPATMNARPMGVDGRMASPATVESRTSERKGETKIRLEMAAALRARCRAMSQNTKLTAISARPTQTIATILSAVSFAHCPTGRRRRSSAAARS